MYIYSSIGSAFYGRHGYHISELDKSLGRAAFRSPQCSLALVLLDVFVVSTLGVFVYPDLVVVSLCGFTLHHVLPQELGNLVGTCNLLLHLLAAGLQVAVALEVLADLDARGGQNIRIAVESDAR